MARQLEGIAQTNLFEFYARIQGQLPEVQWAFHVPNGGHRHISVAMQLKSQGVKAGVPDILFPVPSYRAMDHVTYEIYTRNANLPPNMPLLPYVGLAIELKIGKNKQSDEQVRWQARFQQSGWRAVVCYGWEAAAKETILYFGKSPADFYLF
jgi:hypothetical protein